MTQAHTAEMATYESLVEDALRELSAAESDEVLVPVGSGDEGPLMAWFVST
ncbi:MULTISPECIES: hypothetical protein [Streptomyces]|uniref:hypothetical protein n=1 Tax=Streptomyces TaxID=1883 RepID=UPI0009C351F6|nr:MULTISPECIES: hypothetical protein [Streptomyces]AQW54101.1 hypothetical protein SHXM_07564 [Streptomyces hygroscopicus]MBO3679835.1 hypothetical protein [Streptomyces sp. NEAU-YJ-81]